MARACLKCGGSLLDRWGNPCAWCTPKKKPEEGLSSGDIEAALRKGREDAKKCEGMGMPSSIPNILIR
jgi:hypothetical protein